MTPEQEKRYREIWDLETGADPASRNTLEAMHRAAQEARREGFEQATQLASVKFEKIQAGDALERAAKVCERISSEVNNDWNQRLGVADNLVDIADSCATEIRQLAEGEQSRVDPVDKAYEEHDEMMREKQAIREDKSDYLFESWFGPEEKK